MRVQERVVDRFRLTSGVTRWHDGALYVDPPHRREGRGLGGCVVTSVELARELTEIWDNLDTSQINTVLANNVSLELLEFFVGYAEQFASDAGQDGLASDQLFQKLPNLLVIGYLVRLLEERVE